MSENCVMQLSNALVVKVDQEKTLEVSAALEQAVDDLWAEEKQLRGDALFDGRIFHAEEITPDCVSGHWIPYRYALAGYRNPLLARQLGVLPVAVNGVAYCQDRFLLGLRSDAVTCFAGVWELAPSGGVDPMAVRGEVVDCRACLLTELEEETGIQQESVMSVQPWIAVIDRGLSALELCFRIELSLQAEHQLVAASSEYSRFLWLTREQLPAFCSESSVLPLSELLIEKSL